MRIFIISPAALPTPPKTYGGIEFITYWLAKGLSELGHDVALGGLEGSEAPNDKVKLYNLWRSNEKYAEVLLKNDPTRLDKVIEEFKPDIVSDHTHEKQGYQYLTETKKIPVVPSSHTIAIPDLGLSKPSWTTLSNAHSKWIKKRYGVSSKVTYNGIETSVRPIVNKRAKIGNYIYIGRPNPEKGALEVIDYCRAHDLPLDVIAGRLEIEPIAYAMLIAQSCKIGGRQIYHGAVSYDKKMTMLSMSKGFMFFPHWPEPFGLTPVESQFVGTPVIVNDMGAMPELVEDGKTGFVIPVKRDSAGEAEMQLNRYGMYVTQMDEQAINDAVSRLGELDLEYIAKWSREKFSIKAMAEGYLKVFEAKLNGESW